jgi:HipA-like protein
VVLNGRDVGTLTKASSGAIGFRYAPSWLEEQNAIPVSLSLPLREDGYVGEPVIAVFDNLLTDNKPVRESVAAALTRAARTPSACCPPLAATASVRCSSCARAMPEASLASSPATR